MIEEAIKKVVEAQDLTRGEARQVMREIMDGKASDPQIAALLVGLRMKKETVDEISGFAEVMREKVVRIQPKAKDLVDTCGTGGDGTGTFNISTATAFVVAGAGVPVAKHMNRSISSACGCADVLEALGVKVELSPADMVSSIDEVGIGFLFAPALHPAMKYAMPTRRAIGVRTVFNILGPLTNPAFAPAQLLGVFDGNLTDPLAHVLGNLGTSRALVVHGEGGLDELSTLGDSTISELKEGEVTTYKVNPKDFELPLATLADLKGGDPEKNALILRAVLSGEQGPRRDIVLLNAGAALMAAGRAQNIAGGIKLAAKSIDDGAALEKLDKLIEFTNKIL